MKGNRRADTSPELAIRSALHRQGARFRKDLRIKAGDRSCSVDIVFTRRRLAVFVDGCFWHRCPDHGRTPGGKNADYWTWKLSRNSERDAENTAALEQAGWTVLRIWEHTDPEEAASLILAHLPRDLSWQPDEGRS